MKYREPITQKNPFGCGIACTAFVLGLSYSKTLNLFENGKYKANKSGFYCKEIVNVLGCEEFSYKYVKDRIKNKIYKDYSIVFIKRSKKYPAGHYLCRYKNKWMDPWINFLKDQNIKNAKSGFRKRLPGKPIYVIFLNKKIP